MKNLVKAFPMLSILLLIVSCGSDDGGSSGPTINFEVIGIWDLVEVNISAPQDIDLDGTPSSNLIEEVDCLTGTLLIDADFSWSFEQSGLNITPITNGDFFAQCSGTISSTGTWLADENEVRFQGGGELQSLSIVGETLVSNLDEDLPGVRSFIYARRQ
ncbi:hypothetical protein [Flagellimonas meishanensis]|uniref:hypothetical protein n=1 Tax=Flagellimonas meishanensis TaxID=2873264 RepID=UPI001CA6D8B4|nr:hypothetical protein [[Muricauda] meishanensis]